MSSKPSTFSTTSLTRQAYLVVYAWFAMSFLEFFFSDRSNENTIFYAFLQSITYLSFQRKTYFPLFLYFFWKTIVPVKITMYFYLYEYTISVLFFLFLHKKRLFLWKNDTPFSIDENNLLDVIDKYIKIFTFNIVTTFVKLRFTKVWLIFIRKQSSFLFCPRVLSDSVSAKIHKEA